LWRAVLCTTTTLPEDGWMTTMLAPSIKSFVQKQLSGIDSVEQSEYRLGDHRLLFPPPPPPLLLPREEEDAVLEPLAALGVTAPVVLTLAVLVDSRLKQGSGIVELCGCVVASLAC
jgi:hypothetical protein